MIFKESKMKIAPILFPWLMAILTSTAFAQVNWQTTHTTNNGFNSGLCELTTASLRVKVFPAFLDVEEDVEIAPVGIVDIGNDPKTLEIVGTFSLPSGSAITGALLWDGTRILEGKLLDRGMADSLYESMVERNSIPPIRPRDPLIIESLSKDNYRFRIYPAEPGRARHMRLRYQLPPTIGAQGLEIALTAAVIPLFANADAGGTSTQIPVTIVNGLDMPKVIFAMGNAVRTEMVLPRTRLMSASELGLAQYSYDMWGNWVLIPGVRIYPIDPRHQVMVKTAFPSGTMAGNYLNLYATVSDEVLQGLHQRVEVVVLWKWHNPGTWIKKNSWGEEISGYLYQAQNQAAVILALYQQLGGAGNKVGLLHDDSKGSPHTFKVASREEPSYIQGREYLEQVQGEYISEFSRGIKILKTQNGQTLKAGIGASKERFLSNMRLVKTLYSPETGVIRHLLVLSSGDDFLSDEEDMNLAMDKIFEDQPVTMGPIAGFGFNQVGFNFWDARRTHAYKGPMEATPWGEIPGLPVLNINVVVKNAKKAYDFSLACSGGLNNTCASLAFHGKSDEVWNDTLKWEAYDRAGKLVASTETVPKILNRVQDTAVAILWAGSDKPFSEKKELPLGPVYGFVDRWASLLSLKKDSLSNASTYADTGVPNIANTDIKNVIPNYDGQLTNPNGNGGGVSSSIARIGSLTNPGVWRVERGRGNTLLVHIPGMAMGLTVEAELFDLSGKRASLWSNHSGSESLTLDISNLRSGLYLLKIRVAGIQGVKRITL
jgi:hypothetical protein